MIRAYTQAQLGAMRQAGDAAWVDTGGRLSGAPVFTPTPTGGGGGWALSLTGGWSATDPFDGPHIIYPALQGFTVAHAWAMGVELMERTPPGSLSSEVVIYAGICNENADSGTIDAVWVALAYTAASRVGRRGAVANGVVSSVAGAADLGIRSVPTVLWKCGEGATARWQSSQGRACDANHAPIAAANMGNTDIGATGGEMYPRPFIAVGRSALGDATTRDIAFDVRFSDVLPFDLVL